jgi:hypothetical protein
MAAAGFGYIGGMRLGWLARRRLRRQGFVQLRGVVPRARVEAALRLINRSLGEQGLPPERLAEMRARTYCPELVSAPEILDLFFATPVRPLVEATIGAVRSPVEGQIALRFPQPEPDRAPIPHIDGISSPENGVPAGTLYHFTALLGVFLSDVVGPRAGNLVVWPRSHEVVTEQLRRHGPRSIIGGLPPLEWGPPQPLEGRAGDVVLAHYAVAHGVARNLGPHVRYAVFFRLFHVAHDERALTEPWREWEGMG